MKKVIFATVSALAMATFADGVGSTEFGALAVPSSAAQTIVSVPWLESGTGSASVTVSNLVLTAGLNVGDELKYWNGSDYDVWKIADDGQGKYWKAADSIDENLNIIPGKSASISGLDRGKAIILKRGAPIAEKFYIMGKPTNEGGSVSLSMGYTLVAPPFVTDTDVNSLTWTGIEGQKDTLLIPNPAGGFVSLTWKATQSKWRKWTGKAWTTDNLTIPAGTGVWFSSTSNTGGKSVSWSAIK